MIFTIGLATDDGEISVRKELTLDENHMTDVNLENIFSKLPRKFNELYSDLVESRNLLSDAYKEEEMNEKDK